MARYARSLPWVWLGVLLAACSLETSGGLSGDDDAGAKADVAAGGKGGAPVDSASEPPVADAALDVADAPAEVAPPSCSVFSPTAVSMTIDGQLHCYWRSATGATFTEAQQACASQNGQLASVRSQAENDTIRSIVVPAAPTPDVWLGATDGKQETEQGVGTWAWLSGEPFDFSPWAPDSGGEPDGLCECDGAGACKCHHVLAMRLDDGLWFDRWQGNVYGYVCEGVAGPA